MVTATRNHTSQRENVSRASEARFERYASHETREKALRRQNETTDQAERLAAPMSSSYEYELTEEGLMSPHGELLRDVLTKGLETARRMALTDSSWELEVERNLIELEELDEIEAFARAAGQGVRIGSTTLDGSDYKAMQAVAAALDYELPGNLGSENILRYRMWNGVPPAMVVQSPMPDAIRDGSNDLPGYHRGRKTMMMRVVTLSSLGKEEHDTLTARLRSAYDASLTEQHGGEWYAGRRPSTVAEATTFVSSPLNAGLLDSHMEIVDGVFARTKDHDQRNRLLEPHRFNLAAALDDRMHDRQVESLSDAGATARAEGREFEPYCPTGAETTQTAAEMDSLGYGAARRNRLLLMEHWSKGICVNCERTTMIWKQKDKGCNICKTCAAADTEDPRHGLKDERRRADAERALAEQEKARRQNRGHFTGLIWERGPR